MELGIRNWILISEIAMIYSPFGKWDRGLLILIFDTKYGIRNN